jgi:hypothetical protein
MGSSRPIPKVIPNRKVDTFGDELVLASTKLWSLQTNNTTAQIRIATQLGAAKLAYTLL